VSNDYETTLAHTYPSRTFQRYQEQVWKSQHDKTKQTTFLSKLMVAKFNGPNSFCKGALIKKILCVQCNKHTSLLPLGCNKKLEHLNQIQVLNNFKMISIYLYLKVILLYHDGLQYVCDDIIQLQFLQAKHFKFDKTIWLDLKYYWI
jgi:hypothetical protein